MNTDNTAILERIEACLTAALPGDAYPDLAGPCGDLLRRGGKRWRSLLLVLGSSLAANNNDEALLQSACKLTPLVEFAHTASLIHDDIEDSSDTRRGAPAAHILWGVDTALNAASWLYFEAAACIERAAAPPLQNRLYSLYMRELRQLHLGQAMDIAWHKDNAALPSLDEYLTMIRFKTGTLASLAMKTGMTAGGAADNIIERAGAIAADIGAAFQILDDVINLTMGNPGKKRGDDIVEGKKSFPVLLHTAVRPDDFPAIAACFDQAKHEGPASPAVERCIALLEQSGSISKAAETARGMITQASAGLKALYPDRLRRAEPIIRLFEQFLTLKP
ncbi:MAG: polyprenyl synthetase family protein [Treponema sp.]|nr:polyprenyl synthetase family protein [Treponema sp.]